MKENPQDSEEYGTNTEYNLNNFKQQQSQNKSEKDDVVNQ